jgi:flagellar hook protein FlgE
LDLLYTRDGALTLDNEGNLLNSDGLRVLGYAIKDDAKSTTSLTYDANRKSTFTYIDTLSNITTDPKLIPLKIPEEITVPATAAVPAVVADPLAVPPVLAVDAIPAMPQESLRVKTFYIEKDGSIKAVLEGGKVAALGQIAVSTFKNPAGLEKVGGNLYQNTSNSGDAVVRTGVGTLPADDNSGSYGDMLQGMLEMSNVDLAEQFTDMIITQRAFQAAGKTITTGDEILQEILNLKR